jgi:Putative metal-binding motif/Right handed beta helix region
MRGLGSVALVAVIGCTPKEIDGPGTLEVTPAALDFGVVPVGGASTLEVTLTNSGGTDVGVLSVSVTEGDPDLWTVDRRGVDLVAGGESATLGVSFRPEEIGALLTGQVQVRTDLDEGSFYVTLSGEGGPSADDYDQDGFSAADGDCDDGDASQYPGAQEICDGQDTDCNGVTPPEEADDDSDGYRVCDLDCDDGNGQVHPGAEEICDGEDNDCDTLIPDNDDQDSDGYSICDGDCDDDLPNVNPGRVEICDGVDNDCDGGDDNVDEDLDGHTLCSAAGDCDDTDPNAYPIAVSPAGNPYGTGTDLDPLDTVENGLLALDTVCRTLVLEPGTYADVGVSWTAGAVTIVGRTGAAGDVTLVAPAGSRQFLVDGASLTLRDLTLSGGDSPADGGAVQVLAGELTLDGVVLSGNHTGTDGGAVAATSADVTLIGVVFDGNDAADDGGALVSNGATVIDVGSVYRNNVAARGGAMYVVGGTLALDGVEVRANTAAEGGGVAISGAGAYAIERSALVSNHATADGGGIAMRDVPANAGWIRNNRVQDNLADATGGGFALLGYSGAAQIVNNSVTGNSSVGSGGALYVDLVDASAVSFRNNVLYANDGPAAVWTAGGPVVAYNTAFLTNSGVHFAGDVVDGYGNPLDPTNVVRNPSLVAISDDGDPDNDDLSLAGGSTEIDAGDPDPQYNDADGSINDRGYEGGPAAP